MNVSLKYREEFGAVNKKRFLRQKAEESIKEET